MTWYHWGMATKRTKKTAPSAKRTKRTVHAGPSPEAYRAALRNMFPSVGRSKGTADEEHEPTHYSAKFFARDPATGKPNSANVHVRFPSNVKKSRTQAIIDKHPSPQYSLAQVGAALAKVGAAFVPWSDGTAGYVVGRYSIYR